MIIYYFRRNRYRHNTKLYRRNNPKLVIIDSIQTMYRDEITSAAGSVSQVREITSRIMRMYERKT